MKTKYLTFIQIVGYIDIIPVLLNVIQSKLTKLHFFAYAREELKRAFYINTYNQNMKWKILISLDFNVTTKRFYE